MPWIYRYDEIPPSPKCKCKRPKIGNTGFRSIWQCDLCQQKWRVEYTDWMPRRKIWVEHFG